MESPKPKSREELYTIEYTKYAKAHAPFVGTQATDMLKMKFPKINKEILVSLCYICGTEAQIYRPRPIQRLQSNAEFFLNSNFDAFKNIIESIRVDTQRESKTGKITGYKYTIMEKEYFANSRGKIDNLYGGKRGKKGKLDEEIARVKKMTPSPSPTTDASVIVQNEDYIFYEADFMYQTSSEFIQFEEPELNQLANIF